MGINSEGEGLSIAELKRRCTGVDKNTEMEGTVVNMEHDFVLEDNLEGYGN